MEDLKDLWREFNFWRFKLSTVSLKKDGTIFLELHTTANNFCLGNQGHISLIQSKIQGISKKIFIILTIMKISRRKFQQIYHILCEMMDIHDNSVCDITCKIKYILKFSVVFGCE